MGAGEREWRLPLHEPDSGAVLPFCEVETDHVTDESQTMSDELAFLSAILKTPADDVNRLVYADWLDERAEFLRLDCHLTSLGTTASRRLRRRCEELGRALEPDRVALVRRQQVPDAVETALTALEDMLGGLNYVVSPATTRSHAPVKHVFGTDDFRCRYGKGFLRCTGHEPFDANRRSVRL